MENTLKQDLERAFSEWAKTGFTDEEKEKQYEELTVKHEEMIREQLNVVDSPSCSLDDEECLSCGS